MTKTDSAPAASNFTARRQLGQWADRRSETPRVSENVRFLALVLAKASNRRQVASTFGARNLRVEIAASSQDLMLEVGYHRPSVLVVEESCLKGDLGAFIRSLREVPGGAEVPVLLVGLSNGQVGKAMGVGITDVVRRPVVWEIVARRALRLAENLAASVAFRRAAAELDELRLRERANARVQLLETVDELTGLPNREMFGRIVGQSIPAAHRRGLRVALFHIDIDRFSEINQTLGRRVGDRVIQEVGERLTQCLRETSHVGRRRVGPLSTTISRLGADEFAVLLGEVACTEEAEGVAEKLLTAVSDVVVVDDREVFLTASLGVALSATGTDDRDALLLAAESVTAEARREGGARARIYSPDRNLMTAHKRMMMSALRGAIDRKGLVVRYQPIIDVSSGRMVGAEALLRWRDPSIGVVSPGEFVPLAEETGMILTIGAWVLNTACMQLRNWIDAGLPKIRMAVNVSLRQLQRGNLHEVTRKVLEATGIDPSMLELEISERGGLPNDPMILKQLHSVRDLGVRLSIDDFGTGESAIAYLRRLPINMIKIDRSYVSGLDSNDDNVVIASAMIAMAHGLNLEVVAEGVEVPSQLRLLEKWGCDEFQGFLYSKAIGAEAFAGLLLSEQQILLEQQTMRNTE